MNEMIIYLHLNSHKVVVGLWVDPFIKNCLNLFYTHGSQNILVNFLSVKPLLLTSDDILPDFPTNEIVFVVCENFPGIGMVFLLVI